MNFSAEESYWSGFVSDGIGWFKEGVGAPSAVLVVLVHGFNSDYREAFSTLMPLLDSRLNGGYDVYSFHYPSRIWHAGNYKSEAARLAERLKTDRFRSYRHLIFIAHSTGGLLVKELLLKEFAEIEGTDAAGTTQYQYSSITFRTRQIVNLAVAHAGGSLLLTLVYMLGLPLWLLLGSLFALIHQILSLLERAPRLAWGINVIAWQLTIGRCGLKKLEKEYSGFLDYLDRMAHPRPVSTDYLGADDQIIAHKYKSYVSAPAAKIKNRQQEGKISDNQNRELRGSHTRFKRPDSANDYVVDLIVDEFEKVLPGGCAIAATVADLTLVRMKLLENRFKIRRLLPESDTKLLSPAPAYREDPRRMTEGSWLGSQQSVKEKLCQEIRLNSSGEWMIVGGAGVGKSAVTRHLSGEMARLALRDGVDRSSIPLLIPLLRYGQEPEDKALLATTGLRWDSVADWWIRFTNSGSQKIWPQRRVSENTPPAAPGNRTLATQDWLLYQLKSRACVLIDGADDFLTRYPTIGVDSLRELLNECKACAGEENQGPSNSLSFVIGYRSHVAGPDLVPTGNVYEIARLTEEQAISFPNRSWSVDGHVAEAEGETKASAVTRLLLDRIGDPKARALILTPLILAKLLPKLIELSAPGESENRDALISQLTNPAGIFEQTLRILIEQSGLHTSKPDGITSHRTSNWMDAITLVADVFFSHFWPVAELDDIQRCVAEHLKGWEDHFLNAASKSGAKRLLQGFKLAADPNSLKMLLERSVFLALDGYRLEHRSWEEFLAARHLRYAVEYEYIGGISNRGSWTQMHHHVGDMFLNSRGNSEPFAEEFIGLVHEHARKLGLGSRPEAQIPIGNLLGVIGHSTRDFPPRSIRKMLGICTSFKNPQVPKLVELVGLETLGYRAVRVSAESDVQDSSGQELRGILLEHLQDYTRAGASTQTAPAGGLIMLVAHLLEIAIVRIRDGVSPDSIGSCLSLAFNEKHLLADSVKFIATAQSDGKFVPDILDQTMQDVLINMMGEVLPYPGKALACATYIFPLLAGYLSNALQPGVSEQLEKILDRTGTGTGASLANQIRKDKLIPELGLLWEACGERIRNSNVTARGGE